MKTPSPILMQPLLSVIFRGFVRIFLACACLLSAARAADDAPPAPAEPKKPLQVKVEMRDGLRFEPPRFAAQPGQQITVTLSNADSTHQQHNFLVIQPGKLKEIVEQSLTLGENGPKQQFIPVNPAILVHSAVLDPEKTSKVTFTMPNEKGIYPFVCSMPGHGVMMYGAIYAGEKMPPLKDDPNVPPNTTQHGIAGAGQRPYVQRIFMPDSGPASIAVALPGTENYCWDAGACRLRYAWSGDFIDAAMHWKGNGSALPTFAAPWWTAPEGEFPLQIGDDRVAAVKFLGYAIKEGLPEFHYRVGATEVFERISAAKDGVDIRYRIPHAPATVRLHEGGDFVAPRTFTPEQAVEFHTNQSHPAIIPP